MPLSLIILLSILFFPFYSGGEEKGTPSISGLILMPTAYSPFPERYFGLSSSFLFHYYIGDIYYAEKEGPGQFFNQLQYLLFSSDIKCNFVKEKGFLPAVGIASNIYASIVGKPASQKEARIEFTAEKINIFPVHFLVISKRLKNLGVHIGVGWGKIGLLINPLLVSHLSKKNILSHLIGIDILALRREIKLEYIHPQKSKIHLINLFIPKLFGFNLSYLNSPEKYSILGYFSFRFNIFP